MFELNDIVMYDMDPLKLYIYLSDSSFTGCALVRHLKTGNPAVAPYHRLTLYKRYIRSE